MQFGDSGMVFLCGKSGAGKSTLLHLIGGLDSVTSGEIVVDNQKMGEFTSSDYDCYRNAYIGFVFQEFNLIEEYTVRRNIELALKLQGELVSDKIILEALEKVGMEAYIERYPNELSGGQRQRIAIARALIKNPDIILADEPTGALDSENGELVFNLLKELSKEKLVIIVTHDIDSAKRFGDRVIELKDGRIVSDSAEYIEESGVKEYKKIPSRLPLSYALRMGLSGLKCKKGKLVVACMLLCISLALLGIANLMSDINSERIVTNSVIEEGAEIVGFRKNYNDKEANYKYYDYITDVQALALEKNIKFLEYDIPVSGNICIADNSIYDKAAFHSIIEIDDENDLKYFGYALVEGAKDITADNEVYITDFLAEALLRTDKYDTLEHCNELIGETIICDFISLKIAGIVDTKYASIENGRIEKYKENGNLNELSEELNSIYGIIFANKNANALFFDEKSFGIGKSSNVFTRFAANAEDMFIGRVSTIIYPYDDTYIMPISCQEENKDYVMVFGKSEDLKENEIIVSPQVYLALTNAENEGEVMAKIEELDESLLNVKVQFNFSGNYDTSQYNIDKEKEFKIVGIIINTRYKTFDEITGDMLQTNTSILNVGDNGLIVSGEIWNDLIRNHMGIVSKLYVECSSDRQEIEQLIEDFEKLGYRHDYKSISNLLYGVEEYTDVISVAFIYLAVILFFFVVLLLSNYISVSIAHKRKEIGILRAIGARSIDIVKIFVIEGILIAVVSAVLAIIGELVAANFINTIISEVVNIRVAFIHVYIVNILIIFSISVFIGLLATILSTRKITRQKPVDAIRGL